MVLDEEDKRTISKLLRRGEEEHDKERNHFVTTISFVVGAVAAGVFIMAAADWLLGKAKQTTCDGIVVTERDTSICVKTVDRQDAKRQFKEKQNAEHSQ